MKITTFNPQIITKYAEPVVELFEQLGFVKRHDQKDIGELNGEGIRMRDENGFYIDIAQTDSEMLPAEAMASIRMNVDDFDEAYKMFISRGFKNIYGDHAIETKTSRSALLIAPSGFSINLIQHIKK